MKQPRPSEAIFADGRKRSRPLALHPDAIGVAYPTRKAYDYETHKVRDVVASDVAEIVKGVAVLCIDGPLEHKSDGGWWCFWQTYEALARDFKLVIEDESVSAVVLKFDSPGGEVAGLNETVAILQAMKAKSGKPVVGYVDESCYSAAYALAMVCDEIFLPESAGVGSIGVITAMADVTAADKKAGYRIEVIASGSKKTDGHPHVALTPDAIKRTRKQVNKLAGSFFELVSAGRGLTTEAIAGFQAGTFSGQDAVDVGLADGVLSLEECLTLMTEQFSQVSNSSLSDGITEKPPMSGQIAAAKALNDANAAMSAAKTDADRALCAARVVSAEAELAKVKKTKTVTTDTHEEEVDDGEEESEAGSSDDSDDDDESSEGGESAVEDEEKKSMRGDHAQTGLYTKDRLLRLARQIVGSPTSGSGKKSIEEVMGALHAMWQSHKGHSKLAAEVKKLKADAEHAKVTALVASGLKSGKLAPSQKEWARTQSPAGLKAYLDAAPKMVHTSEDEHTESRIAGVGVSGVSAEMAKIWLKQGFTEKDFPKLLEKLNGVSKSNGAS